jgi:hypothetical protein
MYTHTSTLNNPFISSEDFSNNTPRFLQHEPHLHAMITMQQIMTARIGINHDFKEFSIFIIGLVPLFINFSSSDPLFLSSLAREPAVSLLVWSELGSLSLSSILSALISGSSLLEPVGTDVPVYIYIYM